MVVIGNWSDLFYLTFQLIREILPFSFLVVEVLLKRDTGRSNSSMDLKADRSVLG